MAGALELAGPRFLPGTASRAAAVGRAALRALREELDLYPKPGLVSPGDRGSHGDMDSATFLASLRALRDYFPEVARAGLEGAPFSALRRLGLRAEARMLRATAGVNTHRGAIFGLGLLAAAAARLAAEGAPLGGGALGEAVRDRFGPEILRRPGRDPWSHGSLVARRHGAGGAREEAAAGFPHLFAVGLPALEEALRRGAGRRAAAVQCLMSLVAVLPDTNLLFRGGEEGLAFARARAAEFLAAGGAHRSGWERRALAVHRAFVVRRLSPGGSADLLAATLFVERLRRTRAAAPLRP